MSRQRLISSFAAVCGALAVAGRLAMLYFPMSAPAQELAAGEAGLLHRLAVSYPREAIEKRVEGTVVVLATLQAGTGLWQTAGPLPLGLGVAHNLAAALLLAAVAGLLPTRARA